MFNILYYQGNYNQLYVREIANWEVIEDFPAASRKSFQKEEEAIEYAKELAEQNGLTYVANKKGGYLD